MHAMATFTSHNQLTVLVVPMKIHCHIIKRHNEYTLHHGTVLAMHAQHDTHRLGLGESATYFFLRILRINTKPQNILEILCSIATTVATMLSYQKYFSPSELSTTHEI